MLLILNNKQRGRLLTIISSICAAMPSLLSFTMDRVQRKAQQVEIENLKSTIENLRSTVEARENEIAKLKHEVRKKLYIE